MLVIYLTINTAEGESNLIRNIQFLINCAIYMHSLFGIIFVLFLLKLSAGKGCYNYDLPMSTKAGIKLTFRNFIYSCLLMSGNKKYCKQHTLQCLLKQAWGGAKSLERGAENLWRTGVRLPHKNLALKCLEMK